MPGRVTTTKRMRRRAATVPRRELALDLHRDATDLAGEELCGVEERPRIRGECANGLRPCPFVGCRHHLYLDVNRENGSIKFNFPHLEPWELARSCSLDVADEGENTLDLVGGALNLTREAARQSLERAFEHARQVRSWREVEDGEPSRGAGRAEG